VTNDGTTTSEAACAGVVTIARRPIATVGKPMPIIPFTKPASTNVATVKPSVKTGASIRKLIADGFRRSSSDVAKTGFVTKDGCEFIRPSSAIPGRRYAAALFLAAMIWSAVRPVSSAM